MKITAHLFFSLLILLSMPYINLAQPGYGDLNINYTSIGSQTLAPGASVPIDFSMSGAPYPDCCCVGCLFCSHNAFVSYQLNHWLDDGVNQYPVYPFGTTPQQSNDVLDLYHYALVTCGSETDWSKPQLDVNAPGGFGAAATEYNLYIPCTVPPGNYTLLMALAQPEPNFDGHNNNSNLQLGCNINFTAPGSNPVNCTAERDPIVGGPGSSCLPSTALTLGTVTITAPLALTATVTDQPCIHEIDLHVSGGESPYTHAWSNGATTEDLFYLLNGSYTVTTTDDNGCEATASWSITDPVDPPQPVITVNNSNYCMGQQVVFDAGTGYNAYQWYLDGLPIAAATIQTYEPGLAGNYTVEVVGPNGCTGLSLAYFLPISLNYAGLTVSGGSTLNITNDQIFFNDIHIKQGSELYITGAKLQFGSNAGIIIEPGGKLYVDGAALTALDNCQNMWEGIDVQTGVVAFPQPPLQGELQMGNSLVADAHIGINTEMPLLFGRGIVSAHHTTFLNNGKDVVLGKNHDADVGFSHNTFRCDAPLRDQVQYNGLGTQVHVELRSNKGAIFIGNTFENTGPFDQWERGSGILAYNSAFRVVPCASAPSCPNAPGVTPNVFHQLHKGIDAYGMGSLTHTMEVRGNKFEEVSMGITANSTAFDRISSNTFSIPDALIPNLALPSTYGVYMYASVGYIIEENSFTGSGVNKFVFNPAYGVVVRDAGKVGGEVYRNNFQDMPRIATQSEQQNNALQIKCNLYAANYYDWRVTSGFLADQGECKGGDVKKPAGNEFSISIGNGERQIYAPTVAFQYRHHTEASSGIPNVEPDYFSQNKVKLQKCLPQKTLGSCPSKLNGSDDEELLAAIQQEKDKIGQQLLKNELVRGYLNEAQLSEALAFLEKEKSHEAHKILAAYYLEQKEVTNLYNSLKGIPANNTENRNFRELYESMGDLALNGGELSSINDEVRTVANNVVNTSTVVGTQAEALLALTDGMQYIRAPEDLLDPVEKRSVAPTEGNSLVVQQMSLSVSPNPAASLVQFRWTLPTATGVLLVYDMLGNLIHQQIITGSKGQASLNIVAWPNGLYIGVLQGKDGRYKPQKFVVAH